MAVVWCRLIAVAAIDILMILMVAPEWIHLSAFTVAEIWLMEFGGMACDMRTCLQMGGCRRQRALRILMVI